MNRAMAITLSMALALSATGCTTFVAERYRYSCSLATDQLVAYKDSFLASFPMYELKYPIDGCDDGTMRGFRMALSEGREPPTAVQFSDEGCRRIDDPDGLGQTYYACVAGELHYEVSLEDSSAYLAPMSP